ncbi:MAG TPA: methyltransferase [Sedimentisphaerales bacterium]|nr:methyltransferase [Sedimentisphaerales bacterium]
MTKRWTAQEILDLSRSFQPACVLTAAAVLDVFSPLHVKPMTAKELAGELGTDPRATAILLDALVALKFLSKQGEEYSVPEDVAGLLAGQSADNVLPMVRHLANCLHRWAELPKVTQTGKCAETGPGIRGAAADREDFIGGMNTISRPIAAGVIDKIQPFRFRHILDIGGGPGTWSIAFLLAVPGARATLFDLPAVVSMAGKHFAEAGLSDRVTLVGGDYYTDALPEGVDLAWLGAICHQNSRRQNRDLFTRVYTALSDDGAIVIRDVIMEPSRTSPAGGALFAVNMLVATEAGGTYTFDEYREDLCAAGFGEVTLVHRDEFMNSLIQAGKAQK